MKVFYHFSVLGFSNTYLVGPEEGGDAVLVDPGVFDVELLNLIEGNGFYVRNVLVTHSHESHTRGIRTLKKVYDAEIICAMASLCDFPCRRVKHGDILDFGWTKAKALSLPGHSSDSMAFHMGNIVFTGDTLLAGMMGKTRNSYSRVLLRNAIIENLFSLPDHTVVLPGHGPPSSIKAEKLFNPFLKEKS